MTRLNVMLDSGAFSDKRAKKKVKLRRYIRYCLDNAADIEKAVALDKIPTRRTRTRLHRAAAVSCARWERMRKEGVDAMPVLHGDEPWEFLDVYASAHPLSAKAPRWIGLASAVARRRYDWLDEAWSRLEKYEGVRVHGFAETRLRVVLGYPWYSVDSRTAIKCASYSQAFVPRPRGASLGLVFFGAGDTRYPQRHIRFLPPWEQRRIRGVVEAYGFTVAELEDEDCGSKNCAILSALVFARIVKQRALNPGVRIFQAVSDPRQDPFGDQVGVPDRLVSYRFLRDGKPDLLRTYSRGGDADDDLRERPVKEDRVRAT